MKAPVLALVLVLAVFASAQTAPSAPAQTAPPAGNPPAQQQRVFNLDMGAPANGAAANPKLHAEVMELIELSGARKQLEARKQAMVEAGRKKVLEKCPQCGPAFANAWARRMLERLNIDDFINVYADAYERNFTEQDIEELIALKQEVLAHEPAVASPRLREKVQAVLPTVMGEIMGGCTKVATELGARVGEEIAQEHPEYLKNAAPR